MLTTHCQVAACGFSFDQLSCWSEYSMNTEIVACHYSTFMLSVHIEHKPYLDH